MQSRWMFHGLGAGLAAHFLSCLTACGAPSKPGVDNYTIPAEPAGVGQAESADPATGVTAYVDDGATNVRNDACHATVDTNAGVRVLRGFLDIWAPTDALVSAGVTLPANGNCLAVTPSTWTGLPGDSTDGTIKDASVHAANIAYVEAATAARTPSQELAAYLDDRRHKGYSVTDGMGPLTAAWRAGTQQTTTIAEMASDASTTKYDDEGNNTGVDSSGKNSANSSVVSANANMGYAVDFINAMSGDGSTEPAKRYFKYARPWRWSRNVVVAPSLVPAESATPTTDGGFISGHAAEAWRDALAMAYLVPERFQEMLSRAMELSENRILAGMHSPLDVMGARIQAIAIVAYNLNKPALAALKAQAYAQAHTWLQAQAGVASAADLFRYAHSGTAANDRFADESAMRASFLKRMTFNFSATTSTAAPVVPRGAEMLLETRLPYLTAAQRRVVLKTTAMASGYPIMDDAEGWGRLNLFAAADGYGAFNGDVTVSMDAAQGGFSASDAWKNDIAGPGKLTKQGTGTLRLTGSNTYTGGTKLEGGLLAADSTSALGKGDVFVSGGTLLSDASGPLAIGGNLTVLEGGALHVAMKGNGQGVLSVGGAAIVDKAALRVSFPGDYKPAVGDTLTVLTAGERHGSFGAISVDGFTKVSATYTSSEVHLTFEGT
jgi:autotransporter-associated beta strand protein